MLRALADNPTRFASSVRARRSDDRNRVVDDPQALWDNGLFRVGQRVDVQNTRVDPGVTIKFTLPHDEIAADGTMGQQIQPPDAYAASGCLSPENVVVSSGVPTLGRERQQLKDRCVCRKGCPTVQFGECIRRAMDESGVPAVVAGTMLFHRSACLGK